MITKSAFGDRVSQVSDFSSFTGQFRSKWYTRRGITQGLICFRDIAFGVKGQGHKVFFETACL